MSLTPFQVGYAAAPTGQVVQRLTFQEDHIPREILDLVSVMHTTMQERSRQILEEVEKFSTQSDKLIEPLGDLCIRASEELSSGALSEQRVQLLKMVMQTARIAVKMFSDTCRQSLLLQRKGREIFADRMFNVVCVVMQARQMELQQLQEQLAICYRQEDHAIAIELDKHRQTIQMETQIYNQIFELEKMSPTIDGGTPHSDLRVQIAEIIMQEKRKML